MRLDIGQQRFLAGIEFDDFGHEGIDRLVVGHARARRIGDRQAARAIDVHQSRHAQHAVLVEGQRIEEFVVDAAIDHVDRVIAACGAHRHTAVDHAQVAALDQLGTHLVGEESVFEIGGVVDPRGQHRDRRLAPRTFGRAGGEALGQPARVIGNLFDRDAHEQFGEHRHHGFAVFEHVAHPRGGARIVFEHVEFVRPGAHQVYPDDMRVNPARRREADHVRQPGLVVAEQAFGDAARANDLLPVVEIVHKGVERGHTLLDPARQLAPFGGGDHPRHHVERDQPFLGLAIAIDVEGDAGLAEIGFGFGVLAPHEAIVLPVEPVAIS